MLPIDGGHFWWRIRRRFTFCLVWMAGLTFALTCMGQEAGDPDEAYVQKFLKEYTRVTPPPALESYATAARYDALYMGESLDSALKKLENDNGGLAWGFSYRMMSLNAMYRATRDTKYLDANLRCIRAVLSATDEKRGKQLFTGRVVAAWGCDKYAERGRAVFAVHTGIICAPMLEFLLFVQGLPDYRAGLGDEYATILTGIGAALAVHDRQWRDGPGPGEGYYIGMDQENSCDNKPLPGNRLSAMGWALWESWKVTSADGSGNEVHRDRALGLGRYIKNRLTAAPDGAYYWPYWLSLEPALQGEPRESIRGEDTSHAGLTVEFPFVLAADNQVFTADDLGRFAKTVLNGFGRRSDGILISCITGATHLNPSYLGEPARWLVLSKIAPEVTQRIVPYYLNFQEKPRPLGLSQLVLLGK